MEEYQYTHPKTGHKDVNQIQLVQAMKSEVPQSIHQPTNAADKMQFISSTKLLH